MAQEAEQVVLEFDNRTLRPCPSQVEDYMHRGEELGAFSVLDYLVGTYEKYSQTKSSTRGAAEEVADHNSANVEPQTSGRRGRPPHQRVRYLSAHPRHDTHIRVVRPEGHNTLPNFIGPRFPHGANPDQADMFAASVLTLLKPWRTLTDLKDSEQTWKDALESFLALATSGNL